MNSLLDLFRSFQISFRTSSQDHHVGDGWIGLECPWCGFGSGKYHLGIHLTDGRCSCWRCGRHNPVDAIRKINPSVDYHQLLRFFGQNHHKNQTEEHLGTLRIPDRVRPMELTHRNYLQRRGFDPYKIEKIWGVQGIGLDARLPWRLFIPIRNRLGQTVSWTTRSIGEYNPRRYYSASPAEEAVPHKKILYGSDLARDSVIVVEGPTDAWAIGPGAVATCGLGFSKSQRHALTTYPLRAVCFDASGEAQARAEELCCWLSAFPGQTENYCLETGADPAEAEPEEIQGLRSIYLETYV